MEGQTCCVVALVSKKKKKRFEELCRTLCPPLASKFPPCGALQIPTVMWKIFLSLMKQRQLLVVVRQQEETEGYAGCQLTLSAFAWQQAQELIVIPGLLGCVYAIINLGTCLFAWD